MKQNLHRTIYILKKEWPIWWLILTLVSLVVALLSTISTIKNI